VNSDGREQQCERAGTIAVIELHDPVRIFRRSAFHGVCRWWSVLHRL